MLAAAAVFTVWLTYRGLVASPTGQRLDQHAMVGSMAAAPVEASHLDRVLDVVSGPSVATAITALTAVALRRSRPRLAVAAAATVVGASLSTQALKHGLARPDLLGLGYRNSFPSGHVTVVAAVAAGAVIVSPRQAQPAVAAAGLAAVAVMAVATLALGWHRPSDAVGAVAVVVGWAALAGAWAVGRPPEAAPAGRRAVVQSPA